MRVTIKELQKRYTYNRHNHYTDYTKRAGVRQNLTVENVGERFGGQV